MYIKKLRKDVRGAALVYVIVAAAILVLLGAATTATAYANLRATQIQEMSDNNFYSADTVMNAIVSGLESDISKAYETAYTQVITNLNNYEESTDAEEAFKSAFLKELDLLLNDGKDNAANGGESFSFMYQTSRIQRYVQNVLKFKEDVSFTISAINGDNHLDLTDEGVILRNLHVTYEDNSGYFDEITTDVKIAIPDFDPDILPPDPLNLHAIVIDDGLEIESTKGLLINGDTYINEREDDKSAILLNSNSSLKIMTPTELIAGGFVKTNENAYLSLCGTEDANDANYIWTEDFDLGRYTTSEISGLTHVYDDLEVNGSYANVRIAGEYYGYSRSNEDVDDSSAININGAHTTLNMADVKTLLLAGTSYVSTSIVPEDHPIYDNDPNFNVQMGEALSVKSNQIAYLVDEKEFIDNPSKENQRVVKFVANPMSYRQYEDMCAANGGDTETLRRIAEDVVLSYGDTYKNYGATVVPIFSSRDVGGAVYLYLNFKSTEKAAAFFTMVYQGDSLLSQRLRTYAAQYLTSLQLNKDTELIINQNYLNDEIELYAAENLPTIMDDLYEKDQKTADEQASVDSLLTQFKVDYLGEGVANNRVVDGGGKKYEIMYRKLIDEDKLREFIVGATNAKQNATNNVEDPDMYVDHHTNNNIETFDNGVIINGTSGDKAIIVDNAGGDAYELGGGKGLVVVTGDLNIVGDWRGTIIVGGRAYCTNGTKNVPVELTVDAHVVESVTPLYFTTKTGETETYMMVLNIFKGYTDRKVNNATNDEGIHSDMISNCITFTNWNRD